MKFDRQGQLDALAAADCCAELVPAVLELAERLGHRAADGMAAACLQEATGYAISAAIRAEREIVALRERIACLEQLVTTDELTGVLNRRGFEAELKRVLDLARRHGETGVLLFVDLDGFKRVNDVYGHAAGDAVLREVAALLKQNVRRSDVVARIGGDEFVVLLTKACAAGGARRRLALERTLQSAVVHWRREAIAVRASIGARAYGPCDCYEALIQDADRRMYAQKASRLKRPDRPTHLSHNRAAEPLPALPAEKLAS